MGLGDEPEQPEIEEPAEQEAEDIYELPDDDYSESEPNQPQTINPELENTVPADKKKEIDIFDLDNIDFSQRQERRRGDRRRGFRRIDDRNLISRAREEADAIKESAIKEG